MTCFPSRLASIPLALLALCPWQLALAQVGDYMPAASPATMQPAGQTAVAGLPTAARAPAPAQPPPNAPPFMVRQVAHQEPAAAANQGPPYSPYAAAAQAHAPPGYYAGDTPVVLPTPPGARLDYTPPGQPDRIAELEARLRELETQTAANRASENADLLAPAGKVVGADKNMTLKWNNGLEASTGDKAFRIHVGGRTQLDSVWLTQEPGALAGAGGVGAQDAVDFRRARLRIDGVYNEVYEFAAEYDFANSVNVDPTAAATENNVVNVPAVTDLWWTIKQLPVVGNLRIGNMKEPIGLEHLASSRFLDFMERAYLQDAFVGAFNNGFTPGMMFYNNYDNDMGMWQVGLFKNTANAFGWDTGDGEGALTGRMTRLLWYDEPSEGRYLCHVALAGSVRDPDQDRLRVRSRMSLRNGPSALNPVIADTGNVGCTQEDILGGEIAIVNGPWLLQAEYMATYLQDAIGNGNGAPLGTPLGTVFVHGWYAEALYFLTGEHRVYERKEARFGRVVPYSDAYLVRSDNGPLWSRGAWQLGLRYNYLDLSNNGLDGGIIQDVTLGVNWFLNPNMKIQMNYVYTHRDARNSTNTGDIDGVGIRVAHDF